MKPILYTNMDIDLELGCAIDPSLELMQTHFHTAIQVCTEINYFISTWGRQAKTLERRMRRVTVGKFAGFSMSIYNYLLMCLPP